MRDLDIPTEILTERLKTAKRYAYKLKTKISNHISSQFDHTTDLI